MQSPSETPKESSLATKPSGQPKTEVTIGFDHKELISGKRSLREKESSSSQIGSKMLRTLSVPLSNQLRPTFFSVLRWLQPFQAACSSRMSRDRHGSTLSHDFKNEDTFPRKTQAASSSRVVMSTKAWVLN